MGLIFEEDQAKGQAVIADFVKGSEVEQRAKVSNVPVNAPTWMLKDARLCSGVHEHHNHPCCLPKNLLVPEL